MNRSSPQTSTTFELLYSLNSSQCHDFRRAYHRAREPLSPWHSGIVEIKQLLHGISLMKFSTGETGLASNIKHPQRIICKLPEDYREELFLFHGMPTRQRWCKHRNPTTGIALFWPMSSLRMLPNSAFQFNPLFGPEISAFAIVPPTLLKFRQPSNMPTTRSITHHGCFWNGTCRSYFNFDYHKSSTPLRRRPSGFDLHTR